MYSKSVNHIFQCWSQKQKGTDRPEVLTSSHDLSRGVVNSIAIHFSHGLRQKEGRKGHMVVHILQADCVRVRNNLLPVSSILSIAERHVIHQLLY